MPYTFPPHVTHVIGSDEAGYGPLAGSLIIAATLTHVDWRGPPQLNDSKKLTDKKTGHRRLLNLAGFLRDNVPYAMVEYTPAEIDQHGVGVCLKEGHLRVHRSLQAYITDGMTVSHIADGNLVFPREAEILSVVKADTLIRSVMAASVLAKAHQLDQMADYDKRWPFYGFRDHAGYPSAQHLDELDRGGPLPIHRRSYAPVAAAAKKHGV